MKAQRVRLRYRVRPPALALSNRELVRAFEEAVKGAGFALSYSQAKRPAPQIAIAAPLPQGVTSDWELAEIYLDDPAPPAALLAALRGRLPEGIDLVAAEEVGVGGPSLQSKLRTAEYEAHIPSSAISEEELRARIEGFMARESWPAEYRRETKVRRYDLRPLVLHLRAEPCPAHPANGAAAGCLVLRMRLRAEPETTARADQVLAELGLPEARLIHRTRLWLDETPAVVAAFRRSDGDERPAP